MYFIRPGERHVEVSAVVEGRDRDARAGLPLHAAVAPEHWLRAAIADIPVMLRAVDQRLRRTGQLLLHRPSRAKVARIGRQGAEDLPPQASRSDELATRRARKSGVLLLLPGGAKDDDV